MFQIHKLMNHKLFVAMISMILLSSCKSPPREVEASESSFMGLEPGVGLCPADSYSPAVDYLEGITSDDLFNEDDFIAALEDSDGYMEPCLEELESAQSDSLSLANPLLLGRKVIIGLNAAKRALQWGSSGSQRIVKLNPGTRLPSTIRKAAVGRTFVQLDLVDFTKIYPGARMARMVKLSGDKEFIMRSIEFARRPVESNLVQDFEFINTFIIKARKAVSTPSGIASLQHEMVALKSLRKKYKVLRSTFQAFGDNGKAPKYIDSFTVILGHIQDGYVNSSSKNLEKDLKLLKKIVDGKASSKIAKELKSFVPRSPSQFKNWMNDRLRTLADSSQQGKKFLAGDYHEVRKEVSSMVTVFNAARESGQAGLDDALKVLSTINGKMGAVQDKLTAGRVSGALNYKSEVVEMTPDIQKLIQNIVANFQIQ